MKLYKYISFAKTHWREPLETGKFYFPTLEELKQANDPGEFSHHWESDSHFFCKFKDTMKPTYEVLFSNIRILCFSRKFSKKLWDEYCGSNGGICYEFDFNKAGISSDITNRSVCYVDSKYTNIPRYVIRNTSGELRRVLRAREMLQNEMPIVMTAMGNRTLTEICVKQIEQEIAFKKEKKFRFELEYRLIHLDKEKFPEVKIKAVFQNGRLGFENLGLRLSRLLISDPGQISGLASGIQVQRYV